MLRIASVVAALAIGATPSTAAAQLLGQVFVEVTRQATGEPVLDLAPRDFDVAENGRSGGIVSAALDADPMKIAVLIDNGDRLVATNALNPLRAGLNEFLDTLAPQHEISLLTIARSVQQRVDFTTDRTELKEGVGLLFPDQGAGARLLDGVRETWDRRFEDDDSFPVMVLVLTDGTEASGNYNDNQYADLIDPLIAKRGHGPRRAPRDAWRGAGAAAVAAVRPQHRAEHRRHRGDLRGADRVRTHPAAARGADERTLRHGLETLSGGLRASGSAGAANLGQRRRQRVDVQPLPGSPHAAVGGVPAPIRTTCSVSTSLTKNRLPEMAGWALGPGPWSAVAANMSYGAAYVVCQSTEPVCASSDVIISSSFRRVNTNTRSADDERRGVALADLYAPLPRSTRQARQAAR